MENIVSTENQSPQSFEVDMSVLDEPQVETPANDSQNSDVHTNTDVPEPEIDERYKDLPREEARLRTLQSQRDSLDANYNKLMKEYEEKDKIAGLFDQMLEDEGLLMSFIREIKPDLVKPIDLGTQLKQQLQKEFGEDFKPTLSRDEAEREDPFGNDAKYYMRVDNLKQKLLTEGGAQENLTIKEYLKKKREGADAESAKYEMEREQVKNELKMSDTEVKAVSDWGLKLKFKDLVKVHRFLSKFPTRNPNITQTPGSHEGAKSEREKFLKDIF